MQVKYALYLARPLRENMTIHTIKLSIGIVCSLPRGFPQTSPQRHPLWLMNLKVWQTVDKSQRFLEINSAGFILGNQISYPGDLSCKNISRQPCGFSTACPKSMCPVSTYKIWHADSKSLNKLVMLLPLYLLTGGKMCPLCWKLISIYSCCKFWDTNKYIYELPIKK